MSFSVIINTKEPFPIITLLDQQTTCQAEIYAFGGLLNSFSIFAKGKNTNVIDGFISVADAIENISNGFKSAKLSPFVCRMNQGKYSYNNQSFKIEKFYLPPHAIHGLIYDALYEIVSTTIDENKAEVVLQYTYNSMDKGYPFNFTTEIIWKLEANQKLSVTTNVQHNNTHEIPFADGWHPYFNLGTSVDECSLQFDSNTMIEFDETLIPTGKKQEDNRFFTGKSLLGIELDNCFELNDTKQPACILQNKNFKLTIQPDKSYPYLQVYTPPHRQSLAIENLSAAPDAFNNGMGLLLLKPNEQYSFTTSYILNVLH